MRSPVCLVVLASTLPLAGADTAKPASPTQQAVPKVTAPDKTKGPAMVTADSGLKYVDTVVGTGASPARGQQCLVHYTGWLNDGRGGRGKKFDSSVDRGKPLAIPIGVGRVIKGWDEGVISMKVGGKRTLYIPSYLGYGPRGAGGDIPPNADLIFDVELVSLQ
ncbi:FKBP-type peptidyl-prolyl cis-trans isomerase [Geothrix sp.]|uniref:FKBP-type peptidyl-prolyl cis-trans isomerase n=1 Tax=Geothrix sp. TaxID=1962974 RepID=UPI003BB022B1